MMGSWQVASGLGRSCRSVFHRALGSAELGSLRNLYASPRLSARRQQHRQQARKLHATAVLADTPYQTSPGATYYAEFAVYKGKGALKTAVISPTWRPLSDGRYSVDRQGTLLLEFAAGLPDAGGGVPQGGERRYDWENKKTFALSALELGDILTLDDKPKNLVHDPNKGNSNQGSTIKSLSISRLGDSKDETYYFALSVKEGSQAPAKVGVTVTRAELAVLRSISNYLITHLLGFDMVQDNRLRTTGSSSPTFTFGTPPPSEPPF